MPHEHGPDVQASEKDTEEADIKDSTDTSEAQFADVQQADIS